MLGDPQPSEVIALPGMLAGRLARALEVQLAEEQRPFGQLAHLLGLAAQHIAEHFGVGTGGGDVLAGDDVFLGTGDHGGEGRATGVVVGAFADEGVSEGLIEGRVA